MARMSGGRALVKSILAHGVDTLFALPGVQMDQFFNALHDEGNAVRVIHTRHEQGAGYLAYGYAAASGKVGAYAVVPGPGFLNTTAALSMAYAGNTPVLAIVGQIPSYAIGRGFGMLHEIPDQLGTMRGLTKWAARVDHPTEAPGLVAEAFAQMTGGRPRPAGLEIALDVLGQECDVALVEPKVPLAPPAPDERAVEAAAKLLAAAERPVIFAGTGVLQAGHELQRLAEALQAPVVAHRGARGVVSDRNPLSLTQPAGHRLWADADVVLAVGTRLQHQRMIWGEDERLKIIRVDIDPTEIKRISRPEVAIVADAREALDAIFQALPAAARKRPSRAAELETFKGKVSAELAARLGTQMEFADALREALPEDGILVNELTQVGYVAQSTFPVYEPRTLISWSYQGALGYGFATALGVKVARPERPVLSINGDGGFMYNVQELATMMLHGIDVVSVVFADGAFGNVRRMQTDLYDGRVIASDLRNPDFVRLAESFDIPAERVETPAALGQAVARAFARGGPALIEVPVGVMNDPWPLIMPGRARPAA